MVKIGRSNKDRFRVRRVIDVPLREVSGICSRRGRNRRMFLVAVDDGLAKTAWFSQPHSDEGQIDWRTSNIAKLSGSMLPKQDPRSRLSARTASAAFCCSRKHLACRTYRPQGTKGGCVD